MKVEAVEELEGGGEEAEGAEISPTAFKPLSPAVESVRFKDAQLARSPERWSCDLERLVPRRASDAEEEVRRFASKGSDGATGIGRRSEVVEVGEPKERPRLLVDGSDPTSAWGGSEPARSGEVVGGGRDLARDGTTEG